VHFVPKESILWAINISSKGCITMPQNNYPTSFQCPPEVKVALDAAAAEEMISASDYVRRALVRSLRADGALRRTGKARTAPTEPATA
jgi:hypothetical protein